MLKSVFKQHKLNNHNSNILLSIPSCCIIRRGKKTSHSSKTWLKRQASDQFTNRARDFGLPSRAYFKLEQINEKHKLIVSGSSQCVIDLGASPGGWSMYVARKLGQKGSLISLDLLTLDARAEDELKRKSQCEFIFHQGDFTSKLIQKEITISLNGKQVDLVLSDMAANFTGDQRTDALRTLSLCEDAIAFALVLYQKTDSSIPKSILKTGGNFLCKFFACGQNFEKDLMDITKKHFQTVRIVKPRASRKESAEKYLLASNFKGTY